MHGNLQNKTFESHQASSCLQAKLYRLARSRCTAMVATLAVATMPSMPAKAAIFDVTQFDWGDTSTPSSLAWAIHQTNSNPGFDTIRFLTDVSVDTAPPDFPNSLDFITRFTDPAGLRLEGNGHTLLGNPMFTTSNGNLVTKHFPREFSKSGGDKLLVSSSSFATVVDNVAKVEVDKLIVDGLNGFLNVGSNTVVTVVDSIIRNAVNFGATATSLIDAGRDSVVNMVNVTLSNINSFDPPTLGAEYLWGAAALSGGNADFNISSSTFDLRRGNTPGVFRLVGGTANVVSSVVLGRGLSISDSSSSGGKQGVLNFVNSLFRPEGSSATARIQAYQGGEANLIASTIQYDAQETNDVPSTSHPFTPCPESYPCNGAPLQSLSGGVINLRSSAVSSLYTNIVGLSHPYANTFASLPGSLTADAYSYVQPVVNQDANALKALFGQPQLLTSGIPFLLDPSTGSFFPVYFDLPSGGYPAAGSALLAAVADADTTNQLINPIDGSVITTDLFGNPRSVLGRRDIGALQATQAPAPLPLLGCGAALAWSRRLRRRQQP